VESQLREEVLTSRACRNDLNPALSPRSGIRHTSSMRSESGKVPSPVFRLTAAFQAFARSEQFAGVLLIICTVVSLALANSPLAANYLAIWHAYLGPLTIEHWINDALMAVFFLLVGLELEREIYVGELSTPRGALLPVFAAAGGMAAPALTHFAFNAGGPAASGFGIPMATDIAFALGILALLGSRVPSALKVFVVAFAVIDDLGAIVLIAVVYTSEVKLIWLGGTAVVWLVLMSLNRPFRIMALWPYLLGGASMWYCLMRAGIHASITGVLLAFAIPFTATRADMPSPSHSLMQKLHWPVALAILPLFALANTGVSIDASALRGLAGDNSLGIALGLVIGKPVGVLVASVLAVAAGLCALPDQVKWNHLLGAGMIGGIGFTMSIFITNLAFAEDAPLINESKLAVLGASLTAGVAGYLWIRFFTNPLAKRASTK
jgi:NhaA family Na+:H+ antiporter